MNKASKFGLTLAMLAAVPAMAAQQPPTSQDAASAAKMLIYISPQEYNNSVLLRHPYYEYWFEQGPPVEAAAKEKFANQFGDVAMCQGTQEANALVWLKPSMFYNPIARTYYGKMVAEVYSGSGASLGTYTARAQRPGSIDIDTQGQVNAIYKATINDLVQQIASEPSLQGALNSGPGGKQIPCSSVTLYSPHKSYSFY